MSHQNTSIDPQFEPETTFQSRCLSKFSSEIDAITATYEERAKKDPEGAFVVFVDKMDGDRYENWITATIAVTHAFRRGAESVTLKRWPA